MDEELLAFRQQGLAEAVQTMGRSVTVNLTQDTTQLFVGVRTELQVDQGQLQSGGFQYKRAFSIHFNDPTLVDVIKPGMSAVDDQEILCKVLHYSIDHLGVLFYFGSVNS